MSNSPGNMEPLGPSGQDSSVESAFEVQFRGCLIARLERTRHHQDDMFWRTWKVVPLAEDPLAKRTVSQYRFWLSHLLELRYQSVATREYVPEQWVPLPYALCEMRPDGDLIIFRGLYIPQPSEPERDATGRMNDLNCEPESKGSRPDDASDQAWESLRFAAWEPEWVVECQGVDVAILDRHRLERDLTDSYRIVSSGSDVRRAVDMRTLGFWNRGAGQLPRFRARGTGQYLKPSFQVATSVAQADDGSTRTAFECLYLPPAAHPPTKPWGQ
jgi:hypothetical protein